MSTKLPYLQVFSRGEDGTFDCDEYATDKHSVEVTSSGVLFVKDKGGDVVHAYSQSGWLEYLFTEKSKRSQRGYY